MFIIICILTIILPFILYILYLFISHFCIIYTSEKPCYGMRYNKMYVCKSFGVVTYILHHYNICVAK